MSMIWYGFSTLPYPQQYKYITQLTLQITIMHCSLFHNSFATSVQAGNNFNHYPMLYLIQYYAFLTVPDNFATSR